MLFRTIFLSSTLAVGMASAEEAQPVSALPPLEVPNSGLDEAALVDLGRILFFDTRLSGDSSTSCASCHSPANGWSDGSELSRGYPGTAHWRNSQTLVNAAYLTDGLHWDGTVPSLHDQVPGAMGGAVVANVNSVLAEERLRQIPEYVQRFDAIWQGEPTIERVSQAIAAFERTLISTDSPFDAFSRGDASSFSPEALRGLVLFQDKAGCASCHSGALTTDMSFHNTSVPPNPSFAESPLLQITFRTMMRDFGVDESMYQSFDRDPGRYLATQDPADLGAMRTPPLRYLTFTAPYMHNGVFYTLEEVVDFYDAGGTPDVFGSKSPEIVPLGLTDQEKSDIVAFLESMSGSEVTVEIPVMPNYEVLAFPVSGTRQVAAVESTEVEAVETASVPTSVDSQSSTVQTTQVVTISLGSDPEPEPEAEPVVAEQLPPNTDREPFIIVSGDARYVVVQPGDTLGTLAEAVYGDVLKYQAIYDANVALIPDPNVLEPGTQLLLPVE